MNEAAITREPAGLPAILGKSAAIGFTMPSDRYIGSLLRTLVASKPNGHFLELGTGIGLSLVWMVDGLIGDSSLTTVDNDPELTNIAEGFFGEDERLEIVCQDGAAWIHGYDGPKFDLVFADAWPGKYSETTEVLELIAPGGFYVVDDMTTQPNWPAGHADNVSWLVQYLEQRQDFYLTKMNWSTGVIVAVRQ